MYEPESSFNEYFEYTVRQARWCPHKSDHLVVLFNDNVVRILNTKQKKIIMTIRINEYRLSVVSPVDNAVDFDFLPQLSGVEKSNSKSPGEIWDPLLVIKANGEILKIEISTNNLAQIEKVTVLPNTPISACSLIVLHCQPPVVIFSEYSGIVYHTLMIKTTKNPVLKVFEQYKLDSGSLSTRTMMDSVKFIEDSSSTYRYFVAHDAGIHAALLPIVESIRSFLTERNCGTQEYARLKEAIQNMTSELRCVKCTLVSDKTTPEPIYGIGLIPHCLETFQVVVLQADATADTYYMDNIFPDSKYLIKRANINELTLSDRNKFFDAINTFLRNARNKRPSMIKVIHEILNNTRSEGYQIFLETAATLRKYGLEENIFVSDVIAVKEQSLKGKLQEQLNAIETLSITKEELKRNAERIAERYEEINDKQVSIMNKAKQIGLRVGGFNTVGDKKQVDEFFNLHRKAIYLQTRFNELVGRLKIVSEQKHNNANASDYSLDVSSRRVIMAQLTEMNKSIQELKRKVKTMALLIKVSEERRLIH